MVLEISKNFHNKMNGFTAIFLTSTLNRICCSALHWLFKRYIPADRPHAEKYLMCPPCCIIYLFECLHVCEKNKLNKAYPCYS